MSQGLQNLIQTSLCVVFTLLWQTCHACGTSAQIPFLPSASKSLSEILNCKPKLHVFTGHGHSSPWDWRKGEERGRWSGQLQLGLMVLFVKRRALTAVPICCASLSPNHCEDMYFWTIIRSKILKLWCQRWWGYEQCLRLLQTLNGLLLALS